MNVNINKGDNSTHDNLTERGNGKRKTVMTYRLGLEIAMFLGIPVVLIIIILKLAGC